MIRWLALVLAFCAGCNGSDPAADGSVDACEEITCTDHGQCVMRPNGPACECDPGYHPEGLSCVEDGTTGPCHEVDCSGHGRCTVVSDRAVCRCDPGYHPEGLACVPDPGPCEGVACSGHGTCVETGGEATCECEAGYHPEGLACVEDPPDPCEGVDCSGHGTCFVSGGTAACLCDDGYHAEGLACVADPDPCEGVSCSGHGSCVDDGGVAVCQCEDGYEPDGLECIETLCHCRERTRVHWSVCEYALACDTAADCCAATLPEPYTCVQDYPYVYACEQGVCRYTGCTRDNQCDTYFQEVYADQPGDWVNDGCESYTDECTGEVVSSFCSYRQTCSQDSDCCPPTVPEPYACNQDYPYVYACEDGACRNVYCARDDQCDTYFAQVYDASYVNLGCEEQVDPCTGEVWYGLCTAKQTCTTVTDCCPASTVDPLICPQDYPYLYTCVDGLCESEYCTSDAQCDAYYEAIFESLGGWLNLGCVEH